MNSVRCLAVAALYGVTVNSLAMAQTRKPQVPKAPAGCATLQSLEIPKEALGLPTGGAVIQAATEAGVEPAKVYCRVTGWIRPVDPSGLNINFQVNLPNGWNHKAVEFGGAGFDGNVVSATGPAQRGGEPPINRGYVTLGSDSGHSSALGPTFALNDEAMENYAAGAIKKTHDVAMLLMKARNGEAPAHFYFAGNSKGGHEAMMAMQRYPADFDGIIAFHPVYNFIGTGLAPVQFAKQIFKTDAAGKFPGFLSRAKGAMLNAAAIEACDEKDGLKDGIISDPGGCRFDLAKLRCPSGGDEGDKCLSDEQIKSVQTVAGRTDFGFPLRNGVSTLPGYPILEGSDWASNAIGASPQDFPPRNGILTGAQTIQYWIMRDPKADPLKFDPAANWKEVARASAVMDANDVDLSRFEARGGKFILVHGTVDSLVNPYSSIEYFDRLVAQFGRERVNRFVKFYLVPGFGHGGGFYQQFEAGWDALTALENWVEKGTAPANQVTTDPRSKKSRPLCEYGMFPKYNGTGDPNAAESFTCAPATIARPQGGRGGPGGGPGRGPGPGRGQ
ncbi:MAG: tannase/feruloyl esterase family alpha/beta hydrolase [Acidobacteriia bacterium]|nr:tannase/feruloyl esterase family alpha/beta hydrolase [Terriglobia bacterium]